MLPICRLCKVLLNTVMWSKSAGRRASHYIEALLDLPSTRIDAVGMSRVPGEVKKERTQRLER
jgi:hypothetical protein